MPCWSIVLSNRSFCTLKVVARRSGCCGAAATAAAAASRALSTASSSTGAAALVRGDDGAGASSSSRLASSWMAAAAAGVVGAGAAVAWSSCDFQEQHQPHAHVLQRTVTRNGLKDPMTSYAVYAFQREMEERQQQQQQQQEATDEEQVEKDPTMTYAIDAIYKQIEDQQEEESKQQQEIGEAAVQATSAVEISKGASAAVEMPSLQQQQPQRAAPGQQATSPAPPSKVLHQTVPTEMTPSEVRLEEATRKAKQHSGGLKLFSGNGNMSLALEIARHLGVGLGKATVGRFADGEVNVVIHENVRGKDVYIVQPTCPPVNDNIMELLLMVSTLRRASARRITVVIPYYGYARQDRKMQARVPISAADVARLMESMGIDRVIAVDLHCGQIQGFFGPRVPVDNLDGGIVGLDYFGCKDLHNPVVVSPDAGGVYRAKKFKEGLEHKYDMQDLGLAMIVKQRARAGSVDQMDLVGDVKDCDCIIVDDMIDTAGTLCKAADVLVANGARRVFAFASHGLLSGPGNERIANSKMEEVVILNTIPTAPQREANEKLTELSVAPLLAQAIFNIHAKKSISALFK